MSVDSCSHVVRRRKPVRPRPGRSSRKMTPRMAKGAPTLTPRLATHFRGLWVPIRGHSWCRVCGAPGPTPHRLARCLIPFPSPGSTLGLGFSFSDPRTQTNSLVLPPCLKVPRKRHAVATPVPYPMASPVIPLPVDHPGNSPTRQRESGLQQTPCRTVPRFFSATRQRRADKIEARAVIEPFSLSAPGVWDASPWRRGTRGLHFCIPPASGTRA